MRYGLAIMSLAAVLGLLPGFTYVPTGPADAEPKGPAIYALVYVGLGKNDPDNTKRIRDAIQNLRTSGSRGAVRDPKVKALRVVKEKDPAVKSMLVDEAKKEYLNLIERDDWAEKHTRTASVGGSAIVRVWFTDGTPEEQVAIVNAIARTYVEDKQELYRKALPEHEKYKASFKKQQEDAGAMVTEENERVFRRQEEELKHPPHVIEWASLPDKP